MGKAWLIAPALALAAAAAFTLGRPADIPFEKHTLDLGANEACALADINGDGRLDIVSGENWFEAPKWARHKFRQLAFTNNYIDDFSDLPLDVDGDGHTDIVSCSWFSRRLAWWRNPGRGKGDWKDQTIDSGFPIEFALLVDLNNDGQAREVLPQFGPEKAPLAWYELKDGAFAKHVASPKSFGHGIGAGDVNRDGRTDIVTPKGWLEAPADPRAGQWTLHADFDLGHTGFIHVLDLNQDGRNDLLTSLAHDYGIFWMEQGEGGRWTKRAIDESWSQAHAVTLADLDGDGQKDFVTGKRYMAHNGKDPGEREPLGVYWYHYGKSDDGKRIEWSRHLIDYSARAGGGMQIAVADLDGDGDLDFVAPGKSGLFLFENLSRARRR
ncbi:MAG: VCBS repeat-containing protein [Acidobacteriota bacterium]